MSLFKTSFPLCYVDGDGLFHFPPVLVLLCSLTADGGWRHDRCLIHVPSGLAVSPM